MAAGSKTSQPADTSKPGTARNASAPCRLYLITPADATPETFLPRLEDALSGGDVACLQIRLKTPDEAPRPDHDVLSLTEAVLPLASAHDVAVLINDRPDLAVASGADGAHVGQGDMAARDARTILGPDRILGVTCHDSRHLAMAAGEDGADYVAFGAFFPTATKQASTKADADLLRWWSSLFEIPCVAIGGITVDNAGDLVQAGADFLAVANGVWGHPEGPARAVAMFSAIFEGRTP